ncbi:hypothetical protein N7501_007586 [Penicillium viridicatum]|nr:hypothetical protein N7501_007586 [Penicillium viridicatum]
MAKAKWEDSCLHSGSHARLLDLHVSPLSFYLPGIRNAFYCASVTCSSIEPRIFNPPGQLDLYDYLNSYAVRTGGYTENPNATSSCSSCSMSSTNIFLDEVFPYWSDGWRNFGIMWAYLAFNVVGALGTYWLAGVPKASKTKGSA